MAQPIKSVFSPEFFDQFVKASQALDGYTEQVTKASQLQIGTSNTAPSSVAELVSQQRQLADSMNAVAKASGNVEKAKRDQDRAAKDLEKQLRAEQKMNADLTNDYGQLSKAYNEAALRAKNYVLQMGAGNPIAQQAVKDAKGLGDQLKILDASVGQHQRNVGNYSSALTGYANTLRGLRGPTKLLGEALGVGAQQADQFRLVIEHSLQGLAAFFRGKEAKATAETADTAATTANTAANARNAAATEANTVAAEAGAVAETELAAATTGASVAMNVFKVTIASFGIGLLLAAIGYLVYEFIEFSKSVKKASIAQEDLNQAVQNADYQKAIEQVSALRINIDLAKQGFLDKTKVVAEYNQTLGKTLGIATDINEVDAKMIAQADAYVKMTLYKAAANVALEDAAKKAVEAERLRLKNLDDFRNSLADSRISSGGAGGLGTGQFNAAAYDQETERIKAAQAKRQAAQVKIQTDAQKQQEDIAKNFMRQAAEIAKDAGLDPFGGGNVQPGSVGALRQRISVLKEKLDTEKTGSAQQIADTKTLIGLEKQLKDIEGHPDKQKKAADLTNEQIKAEAQYTAALYEQLKQRSANNSEIQHAIANDETNNLQKRADAYQNYTFERLNMAGLESAKEQDIISQKLAKIEEIERKSPEKRSNEEKALLLQKKALEVELTNSTEKFEAQRTKIIEDNAHWQSQLIQQYGNEAQQAIRQAQKNLQGITDFFSGSGQKQSREQYLQQERRQYEVVNTYVSAAINGTSALLNMEKARSQARIDGIQAEIDAIEKKKQADIDSVNASFLTQQEKAKKITDITATAAAQEVQKEDMIRREKRKSAIEEKALNVARIGIQGALAVVNELTSGDPYTKIPRAIAVGALAAIELASAIATPIPEFAVGTESAPEGIAKVHEGELIMPKSGKPWVADKDTLTYLQKGSVVKTAVETAEIFKYYAVGMPALRPMPQQQDNEDLLHELQMSREVLKAIRDKRHASQQNKPLWWQDYYYQRTK